MSIEGSYWQTLSDDCNWRLVLRKTALSLKSLTKLTAFLFNIQSQNARVNNERYRTEYIEQNLLFNLSCHVTQRTDCFISQYIVTACHSTGMLKLLLLLQTKHSEQESTVVKNEEIPKTQQNVFGGCYKLLALRQSYSKTMKDDFKNNIHSRVVQWTIRRNPCLATRTDSSSAVSY